MYAALSYSCMGLKLLVDVLEKVVKVPVDVAQLYVGGWEEDVAAMLEGRPAAAAALGGAFQVHKLLALLEQKYKC